MVGFFLYLLRKKLHVFLDFLFQSPSSNTRCPRCLHMQPIPPLPLPSKPQCLHIVNRRRRQGGRTGTVFVGENLHRERRGEKGMEKIKEKPNLRADPHCPKTEKGSTFLGGAVFEPQMSVCGETKEGKALLKGKRKQSYYCSFLPFFGGRGGKPTSLFRLLLHSHTHAHESPPYTA